MSKTISKIMYIGQLFCMCLFAQASGMIEVLGFNVPIENLRTNIQISCSNCDVLAECECFYGEETHSLAKMVATSPRVDKVESRKEIQRILYFVSENLIPDVAGESVHTDYAELWTSNSWGEVAFVKADGNSYSVTVENIAIAKRLNKSGRRNAAFPDDFMGFNLSPRLNETNLINATISIFNGVYKGRYAYYIWEVPPANNNQSFFNCGSCELSLKTRSVLAVRLKRLFYTQDRARVLDECLKIMSERYDVSGMRSITDPITGDVIGGTFGVDDVGLHADFRIEQKEPLSESLLVVNFQLPESVYGHLLSEGTP